MTKRGLLSGNEVLLQFQSGIKVQGRINKFIREDKLSDNDISLVYKNLADNYPDEWLLRLEILEQISEKSSVTELKSEILDDLEKLKSKSADRKQLIESGLELI